MLELRLLCPLREGPQVTLEEAGRLYISRDGKGRGLMIKLENRAVIQYFTASKQQARELLDGKRVWVTFFKIAGDLAELSE